MKKLVLFCSAFALVVGMSSTLRAEKTVTKSGGTKDKTTGKVTYNYTRNSSSSITCTGAGVNDCPSAISRPSQFPFSLLDNSVSVAIGSTEIGIAGNPLENTALVENIVMRNIDLGKSSGKGMYGIYYYTFYEGTKTADDVYSYTVKISEIKLW